MIHSTYNDPWDYIYLQLSGPEQNALTPQQPSDAPPPPPSDDSGGRFIGVPDTMRRIVGYNEDGSPIIEERPFATVRDVEGPAPFDPRLQGRTDILPGGAATVTQRRPVPPRYLDGDEKQPGKFGIGSVEERARIQLALEQAGLLDPSKYRPGEWDEATWKAYRNVLEHANVNGYDWEESLTQLVQNPVAQPDQAGGGGPQPYMPPDYATMAQGIKGWMKQNLRREPRDHEITTLAQQIEQLYRADYDQERQAEEYQMQVEAGLAEERDAIGRDVDVKARFAEMLEERYANELRTVEAEDEAGRTQDIATGFGNLFRSMIGN